MLLGPLLLKLREGVSYMVTRHSKTQAPAPWVLEGWGPHTQGLWAGQQLWGQNFTPW